jgi:hypothetical protein
MSLHEDLNIAGRLRLQLREPGGALLEERTARNSIATSGRDLVARLFNYKLADGPLERVTRIGVGTGDRPFNAQDTGLADLKGFVEITGVEQDVVEKDGVQRQRLRLTGELLEKQFNFPLREAGLFTSEKVMYNRVVFDTISKTEQFRLTLVWEILF